jgi:hypothetical protein
MPSSCPKVVRKQPPTPTSSRGHAPEREKPRDERPHLHALGQSSRIIADGSTTEADLCQWADWFARFHTDPMELYVPLALRSVDCVVSVRAKSPEEPTPPRLMRCIREVAKFNGADGVAWQLVTWVPGLPGVQFCRCDSEAQAMQRLDEPPAPVTF